MENEKLGEMTVEEDTDGKAVWVFEGKIKTDVPLETDAQDIVGAINELFQSGSGGGDVFSVSGSESGITVTTVKNRGDTQELTAENFTFKIKTYKTVTTLKSGKTTIDKTWSKTAISEVMKSGETVWKFVLDAVGNVTAVLDSAGNDVLNGTTGKDGNSVVTPTPEGIALGWALAYNNEQSGSVQKAIEAYQEGVEDCDEINKSEGVGGGDGTGGGTGGDGTGGDGTGGDGGTGDGTGGGKIPEKNFGKYTEVPKNDNGSIPIPTGSGAFVVHENIPDTGYKPDCIVIDVSRGVDKVYVGMFNNDGSNITICYIDKNTGKWHESLSRAAKGFFGVYKIVGGVLYNSSGKAVKLSGDIYYVT